MGLIIWKNNMQTNPCVCVCIYIYIYIYIYGNAIVHRKSQLSRKNTEQYWRVFSINLANTQDHEILNNTKTRILSDTEFLLSIT